MSSPQSITMTIGRLIGDSIKAIQQAEGAAMEAAERLAPGSVTYRLGPGVAAVERQPLAITSAPPSPAGDLLAVFFCKPVATRYNSKKRPHIMGLID